MFHDFGTFLGGHVSRQIFGKICRKSEPSADFMHVGLFPFFTVLERYKFDMETLIDIANCSARPGDLITYINPINETLIEICSIAPRSHWTL